MQFYNLILKPVSGMLGYFIPHFCQQTHNEYLITTDSRKMKYNK